MNKVPEDHQEGCWKTREQTMIKKGRWEIMANGIYRCAYCQEALAISHISLNKKYYPERLY